MCAFHEKFLFLLIMFFTSIRTLCSERKFLHFAGIVFTSDILRFFSSLVWTLSILLAQIIRVTDYNCLCYNSVWLCLLPCVALDARLEVGLEQQAELMLKMMSTLEADSILQALTNTSPTCNYILSNCSLHIMTIWKLCSFFLQLHGSLEEVEFCFNDIVRLCFRDSIQIFKLCMYTFKTLFEVAQIGRIPITVHNNTVEEFFVCEA